MALEHYRSIFKKHASYPLKVEKLSYAPPCAGVYIITEWLMGEEVISYVGSSRWMRARVSGHAVVTKLKKQKSYASLYVMPCSIEDYRYMEAVMIFEFKPRFNKHGILAMPDVRKFYKN